MNASWTPSEKLARVAKLCEELQGEDNDMIVQGRIAAIAKELQVNPYQCGLVYWALKNAEDFRGMLGNNVKVRFKTK